MILRAKTPLGYIKLTANDPMEALGRKTKINIEVDESLGGMSVSIVVNYSIFLKQQCNVYQGRIKGCYWINYRKK